MTSTCARLTSKTDTGLLSLNFEDVGRECTTARVGKCNTIEEYNPGDHIALLQKNNRNLMQFLRSRSWAYINYWNRLLVF